MLKNITIGVDAEVFMSYQDTVVSMIGMIGGTKEKPKSIGNGCFIQEDNILAEFNIPPVTNKKDFVKYINYCKDWLSVNYPELELHFSSSEMIESFILADDKCKEFGCDPEQIVDFNDNSDSMSKDDYEQFNIQRASNNLRTSGFHIHIGYENHNNETNREIVKMFEKYITMPLVLEDLDVNNRRSMYGSAGSYRDKPYGVECRSLGGYFLKNNHTIEKVWDLVENMLTKFNQGERVSKEEFKQIKQIINNKETSKICAD